MTEPDEFFGRLIPTGLVKIVVCLALTDDSLQARYLLLTNVRLSRDDFLEIRETGDAQLPSRSVLGLRPLRPALACLKRVRWLVQKDVLLQEDLHHVAYAKVVVTQKARGPQREYVERL